MQASKRCGGDVKSRSGMAASLILDQMPGMLEMMVQSAYPGMKGGAEELGDEIKNAASALIS
jgi:hypothetical protein